MFAEQFLTAVPLSQLHRVVLYCTGIVTMWLFLERASGQQASGKQLRLKFKRPKAPASCAPSPYRMQLPTCEIPEHARYKLASRALTGRLGPGSSW